MKSVNSEPKPQPRPGTIRIQALASLLEGCEKPVEKSLVISAEPNLDQL